MSTLLRRIGWGLGIVRDSRIRMFPSGRLVDPLSLHVADVALADVAHGLSHINRFNGHTRWAYSVAQHAVLASWAIGRLLDPKADRLTRATAAFVALHHDDGEAYTGDVPSPIKRARRMRALHNACEAAQDVCYRAFKIDPRAIPWEVHEIDRCLLEAEQATLTLTPPAPGLRHGLDIQEWSAQRARRIYLARHDELVAELAIARAERPRPEPFNFCNDMRCHLMREHTPQECGRE